MVRLCCCESASDTNEKQKERAMTTRADSRTQSPELFEKCVEFNLAEEGVIEKKIRDLVAIRVSQFNGCAFCLNTLCHRNTSALLPDRFLSKPFRIGNFQN
jgi:alkylhydroperoxidase family enzyme